MICNPAVFLLLPNIPHLFHAVLYLPCCFETNRTVQMLCALILRFHTGIHFFYLEFIFQIDLLESIERLTPDIFRAYKGLNQEMCRPWDTPESGRLRPFRG